MNKSGDEALEAGIKTLDDELMKLEDAVIEASKIMK